MDLKFKMRKKLLENQGFHLSTKESFLENFRSKMGRRSDSIVVENFPPILIYEQVVVKVKIFELVKGGK
jgi:hypothetical protein